MSGVQRMSQIIAAGCDKDFTLPPTNSSTPRTNIIAAMGCKNGIENSVVHCKKQENPPSKCDDYLREALKKYCAKDNSLEPCTLLLPRPTNKPFVRLAPPTTTRPTTTSTTPEPSTEANASTLLMMGVFALVGVLLLVCLVIILFGVIDKKNSKKQRKSNEKKKKESISKTSSTKSTGSGKSKSGKAPRGIP